MGMFASGVTIVTVGTANGDPHGMTANAVMSVSLDPPLVAVAIDNRAYTNGLIRQEGHFAVNILSDDQNELANRFATRDMRGEALFAEVSHCAQRAGRPAARRLHRPGRLRGRLRARRGRPHALDRPRRRLQRFLGQREPARLPPRDVLVHVMPPLHRPARPRGRIHVDARKLRKGLVRGEHRPWPCRVAQPAAQHAGGDVAGLRGERQPLHADLPRSNVDLRRACRATACRRASRPRSRPRSSPRRPTASRPAWRR